MTRLRTIARTLTLLLWAVAGIGCQSTLEPPSGDPALDLVHADPRIRVLAAHQAVCDERADLVPLLIENLRHRDGAVRFYTAIALRKLTSREFGYEPYGDPVEREEAVRRWKAWAGVSVATPRASGAESRAPAPSAPPAPGAARDGPLTTAGSESPP